MTTEIMNLSNFTKNTPVTIKSGGGTIALSVNDVLNWLAPGAPVKEALGFLRTCQATGLDPWLREIYLINMGNSWGTVIAKAGFLRRGQEHPSFDGYEAGITIQAVDPKWKPGAGPMTGHGPIIDREGSILPDGHKLLGGWCRVWKKGESRPYYSQVAFSEFNRGTGPWKSIPCVMIRKVAVSQTFREAFNMSEVYDESEVPAMSREQYARYVDTPRRPAIGGATGGAGLAVGMNVGLAGAVTAIGAEPTGEPGTVAGMRQLEAMYDGSPDPHLPATHVAEIHRLVGELGLSDAWLERTLAAKGADTVADLSVMDANRLITGLQGIASRQVVMDSFPGQAPKGEPMTTFQAGRPLDEDVTDGEPASHVGDGGQLGNGNGNADDDGPADAAELVAAGGPSTPGGPPSTDLDD